VHFRTPPNTHSPPPPPHTQAWIEFDSPDLAPADLPAVTLGVSEYNEFEVCNLGEKIGVPVAYRGAASPGTTTYRLEINPGLYEGVRFAWLWLSAPPSRPWHLTALRLVCQIKPTNWGGAFAARNDTLLERIWYAGAYTTKVNLLSDQFGSILMYRGDRYSWTGDAHVAQATAMASLGNYDFVLQNLNFTRNNCNGIESYCLYWVLSVCDYFMATNDAASVQYFAANAAAKLEHAHDIWPQNPMALGFIGWDDRVGSGLNSSCAEAQAVYRFLAVRTWRAWAGVLQAIGEGAAASHFAAYADAAENITRASGPDWYAPLEIFAAADAINSQIATPAEADALVASLFNDSVKVCALSNFNTFFFLQALSAAGHVDLGYSTVLHCWGPQILLGATTVWETSQADWQFFLTPGPPPIPGFEDGFTSMAHPWSSGATCWITKWLLGVRAIAPGFASFVVAPHIAGSMTSVRGVVPIPQGRRVGVLVEGSTVSLYVPSGTQAELRLSRVLLDRLGLGLGGGGVLAELHSTGAEVADEQCLALEAPVSSSVARMLPLAFESDVDDAPVDPATGARALTATLRLGPGCHRVLLSSSAADAHFAAPALPSVGGFPPPEYPAGLVARDETTAGSWMGVYGSAGYSLFAYDAPNVRVERLPSFVAGIEQSFNRAQNGPWPTNGTDMRALQDPRNPKGPRKIGQYSVPLPWASGWDPSFVMDVVLQPEAEGSVMYRLAVYCVDFDYRSRRQTITVMDRFTLNTISPTQYLTDFTGSVWLVWEYNRSMRLRFNYVRGDNQVVSAMMFDLA
jgi:alpha-L-rhamnosidase